MPDDASAHSPADARNIDLERLEDEVVELILQGDSDMTLNDVVDLIEQKSYPRHVSPEDGPDS